MFTDTAAQIETIGQTLAVFLAPDQITQLRYLLPSKPDEKSIARTLPASSSQQTIARLASQLDRAGNRAIWFTPNPLHPDFLGQKGGAKAEHISRRRWLLLDCDCDPSVPKGTNATDDDKRAAWNVVSRVRGTLETVAAAGLVVGDSGNGWHVCLPIDMPNDSIARDTVRAVVKGLSARCSDERAWVCPDTFDAPRVWKLYGTTARTGPATPERPHRLAQLIEGQPWTAEAAQANNAALRRLLDMWAWIDATRTHRPLGSLLERAKAYVQKEPPAISGQRGHHRCFHVACVLVKQFGLSQEDAFAAIQDWNATCQPPWSEAELRHKLADAAKAPGPVGELAMANGERNGHAPARLIDVPEEPKEIKVEDIATIDDLIRAGAEVRWLWPGWIQLGVLNAIAAPAGTGKTRFCADLLRRIRHQLPWPDATPMTAPADLTALWVVSDNNHDELVNLARDFDIKETIRLNATKADPYGGVTLDEPADYRLLEARIKALRPTLVIVDTVGNATDRNLTKQEDAKAFYGPLQVIARRYSTAILCLTHLNATGHFLGRRVLEKVRVALRMDQYEEGGKRALRVHKSNSRKPSPLGITMADKGNEYDNDPPKDPLQMPAGPAKRGRPPAQLEPCMEWLEKLLLAGPLRVSNTRTEAEAAGFTTGTLYRAKDALNIEEYETQGKKWWRLPENEEACP